MTIHRAVGKGTETRVGDRTYWMATAHAGHNATVCDEAVLVNGSFVAGHARVGQSTILSGNVGVHQFTWVGRRTMTQGNSGCSMHVPPFVLTAGINRVIGLNSVGLRRADDITSEDHRQIKEAFQVTYRSGLSPRKAVDRMDACSDFGEPAGQFRQFVREVVEATPPFNRGLCPLRKHAK